MEQSAESCLLNQVEKQERVAKKFGFYWENYGQLIEQIQSECAEVEDAYSQGDRAHLQEELGDLIHAAISLVIFFKFNPHETLQKSIEKFQQRYDALVEIAQKDGYEDLHRQSFEVLLSYWNQAKIQAKAKT